MNVDLIAAAMILNRVFRQLCKLDDHNSVYFNDQTKFMEVLVSEHRHVESMVILATQVRNLDDIIQQSDRMLEFEMYEWTVGCIPTHEMILNFGSL